MCIRDRHYRLHNNDPGASHHNRAAASHHHCTVHYGVKSCHLSQILKLCFNLKRRFLWQSLRKSLLNALKLLSAMLSFFLQRRWPKASSWFPNYLAALLGEGRDPRLVALTQQAATNCLYRREPGAFLSIRSWNFLPPHTKSGQKVPL